ncbi:MAG: cytochrome c family protein [Litorimonas sp.]
MKINQMLRTVKPLYLITFTFILTACGQAVSPAQTNSKPSTNGQTQHVTLAAKKDLTPMERGAKLFRRCKSCHTLEDGGSNKLGPNLWNIWGRKAAAQEGFAYSKALTASDITWDDSTLDAYIKKPKELVPGTRMTFIGIKKAQDRADLLLYLKAQTTP